MQIPVFLEPIAGTGYRANAGSLAITAEGVTREETLDKLRHLIEQRVEQGGQLVEIEIGFPQKDPWSRFAGTWQPDDPFIERWEQAVEEYRRQMDEDPRVR